MKRLAIVLGALLWIVLVEVEIWPTSMVRIPALDLFFKKQIEECRELAKHAVDEDDRAFWQQAAARWEEQLRVFQHAHLPVTRTVGLR